MVLSRLKFSQAAAAIAAIAVSSVCLTGLGFADESTNKSPVPEEATLSKARDEVRELFASDFRGARREPQQIALVEKLISLADEIENEPLTRFAMLVEARDLAVQAGNTELAMLALEKLEASHAINVHNMRFAVIEQMAGRIRVPYEARLMSEAAHNLFRQTVDAAEYQLLEPIAKVESSLAKRARDPKAITEARADETDALRLSKRWEDFQDAQVAIEKRPDDAEDRMTVGLFHALDQHKWPEAIKHLKMAGNQDLILAVESELKSPTDSGAQIELADLWHKIAGALDELDQQFSLERSLFWYQTAVQNLSGIDKARIESQIATFDLPLSETEPLYLTNMEEFDVIGGPWGFGKHGAKGRRNSAPIILGGQEMKLGLGMHPPVSDYSQVRYRLDGRFGTFVSTVGLASEEDAVSRSPVVFVLIGDGKPLWKSKPLKKGQSLETCAGDVTGIQVLELRAYCSGGHVNAHACWGDPYVMKARGLAPR